MVPSIQTRPSTTLRDSVDRLFLSGFAAPRGAWQVQWSRGMPGWPLNVFEDEDNYYVRPSSPAPTRSSSRSRPSPTTG
jgi:hypothetical protein